MDRVKREECHSTQAGDSLAASRAGWINAMLLPRVTPPGCREHTWAAACNAVESGFSVARRFQRRARIEVATMFVTAFVVTVTWLVPGGSARRCWIETHC